MSKNSGYDFLGTIIGAGLIGFFIDKYFEIAPWALMGFIVFGFVGATIRAQNMMKNEADANKDEKD